MKVRIDPDKCQGHGRCYDLAPEVFTDDEEGYGTGDRRRHRARRQGVPGAPGREELPREAISIEES